MTTYQPQIDQEDFSDQENDNLLTQAIPSMNEDDHQSHQIHHHNSIVASPSMLTHNYSFQYIPTTIGKSASSYKMSKTNSFLRTASNISTLSSSTHNSSTQKYIQYQDKSTNVMAKPIIRTMILNPNSTTANTNNNGDDDHQHTTNNYTPPHVPDPNATSDSDGINDDENWEDKVQPLYVTPFSLEFFPFFVLILGFFLLFTSYSLVQNLSVALFGTSSGSITIGVVYVFFIPSALLAPVMLTTKQVFNNNALSMMLIGSISYTLLTIACIFNTFALLITGAILVGLSAGLVWVGYSTTLNAYARVIAEKLFYNNEIKLHNDARTEYFLHETIARDQNQITGQITENLFISPSLNIRQGKVDEYNNNNNNNNNNKNNTNNNNNHKDKNKTDNNNNNDDLDIDANIDIIDASTALSTINKSISTTNPIIISPLLLKGSFDPEQSIEYTNALLLPNKRLNINIITQEQAAIVDATTKKILGLLNAIAWSFLNLDVVFGGIFSYFILSSSSTTPTIPDPIVPDDPTQPIHNTTSIAFSLLSTLIQQQYEHQPLYQSPHTTTTSIFASLSGPGVETDVNPRPLFIVLAFASALANFLYFLALTKSPKALFDTIEQGEEQEQQKGEKMIEYNSGDTIQGENINDEAQFNALFTQNKPNNFNNGDNNDSNQLSENGGDKKIDKPHGQQNINDSLGKENNTYTSPVQTIDDNITTYDNDINDAMAPVITAVNIAELQTKQYKASTTKTTKKNHNDLSEDSSNINKTPLPSHELTLEREKNPVFVILRSIYLIYHATQQPVFLFSIPSWFAAAIPICFTYTLFTAHYVKPILGTANISIVMIMVALVDSLTSLIVSKLLKNLFWARRLAIFGTCLQFVLICVVLTFIDIKNDSVTTAWVMSAIIATICGISDSFTQIPTNSAIGMIVDSSRGSGEVKGACFGLSTVFKSTGSIFIFLSGKFISFYTQKWCLFVIALISIAFQVMNMLWEKPIDAEYLQDKYDRFVLPWDKLTENDVIKDEYNRHYDDDDNDDSGTIDNNNNNHKNNKKDDCINANKNEKIQDSLRDL